jgi:hypothetical protein
LVWNCYAVGRASIANNTSTPPFNDVRPKASKEI